jgi:hypothetical protein
MILNNSFFRPDAVLAAAGTAVEAPPVMVLEPRSARKSTPQEVYSAPDLTRFVALAVELMLLLGVFRLYHLETPAFFRMSCIVCGAFLIHYWTPFRLKEPFFVAVSLGSAFYLLPPIVATLLISLGLTFFVILRSSVAFQWRVLLLVAIFAALIYGRAAGSFHIPVSFYPVFGAIFMFRIIIYAYDLAHATEPPRLLPFLSYFFLLPNYLFMLFPVIDFQTMRRGYYRRDIHVVAQQGIHWMTRGAIQLMLYRLVMYFNDPYLPDRVTSLGALLSTMVLTFLLYLNVSGTFHLAIGMLHLFGYDLPETNRRYLLASSFIDFWRRANIYWKDFMVKIVYFPVYFKLRKMGDFRAQLVATTVVFLVTWALHAYQFFWIKGQFLLTWPDTIFWTILGLLIMANIVYEKRHKSRRRDLSWQGRAFLAARTLGTMTVIITLWSLWSSASVSSWLYFMTHWFRSGS